MNDLTQITDRLVGVIDLKDGQAVHAVAGQRDQYRGVILGNGHTCSAPLDLAQHYHRLGVRQLYVADLDGIADNQCQTRLLIELLGELRSDGAAFDAILLDLGWRNESDATVPQQLCTANPKTRFIVATEAARCTESLSTLAQIVGPDRTALGLDFRSGQFVGRGGLTKENWFDAAHQSNVSTVVALDVAAVGTSATDQALPCCEIARRAFPGGTVYSGGGIKSRADVDAFTTAGADFCLAATSLLAL